MTEELQRKAKSFLSKKAIPAFLALLFPCCCVMETAAAERSQLPLAMLEMATRSAVVLVGE
jgi:hypothetical protein